MEYPDAIRMILLILTSLSYIPQIQRIIDRGDCKGLSLLYLLFINIAATEQLAIFLDLLNRGEYAEPSIIHYPTTFGDGLNLAQFIVQWLFTSVLLFLCIYFLYDEYDYRDAIVSAWILSNGALFLPTLVPWWPISWGEIIQDFVNPVVSALTLLGLVFQAHVTLVAGSRQALSQHFVFFQSVIFSCVALGWAHWGPLSWQQFSFPRNVLVWFQSVGWASGNEFIFGFVQATLFLICIRVSRTRADPEYGRLLVRGPSSQ